MNLEDWSEQDTRNLRDTLATETWQKVLGSWKEDQDDLTHSILNAQLIDQQAVVQVAKAQGGVHAIKTMLANLTILSTPEEKES